MKELVYLGHDNLITLQLQDDSLVLGTLENTDVTSVTRMTLEEGETVIADSDVTADAFDWTRDPTAGIVDLKLGGLSILEGLHTVCLVLYSAVAPNGIRWSPSVKLQVKDC